MDWFNAMLRSYNQWPTITFTQESNRSLAIFFWTYLSIFKRKIVAIYQLVYKIQ